MTQAEANRYRKTAKRYEDDAGAWRAQGDGDAARRYYQGAGFQWRAYANTLRALAEQADNRAESCDHLAEACEGAQQ